MTFIKTLVVAALLLSGLNSSAFAGSALLLGAGADPCSKLAAAWQTLGTSNNNGDDAILRLEYIAWLQGFASAASQSSPRIKRQLAKAGAVKALIDNTVKACGADGEQLIGNAVVETLNRL